MEKKIQEEKFHLPEKKENKKAYVYMLAAFPFSLLVPPRLYPLFDLQVLVILSAALNFDPIHSRHHDKMALVSIELQQKKNHKSMPSHTKF
jgi:hypothetical protein